MNWTRDFIGFETKNNFAVDGSRFFFEMTNSTPVSYGTASLSDAAVLSQYRMRNIDGRIYTTVENSAGLECKMPIEVLLLHRTNRQEMIDHRNNNLLDITRENLKAPRMTRKTNVIITSGPISHMHLDGGYTVILDTKSIEIVGSYYFRVRKASRASGHQLVIGARYYDESGKRRRIQLERLLMGCAPDDNSVRHRNGNMFDCTMKNLQLEEDA